MTGHRSPRSRFAALLVASAFLLAACGEDEGGTTTETEGAGTEVEAGPVSEEERVNFEFGGSLPDGVVVDTRESAEAPTGGTLTDLNSAAEAAGCELMVQQKDEGNDHIAGNEPPEYEADPPTSGDHSPEYLADGAFATEPNPLNYIHLLEHGRVEFQYSPDLPEEEQQQLLGLYDEQRAGIGLFPNSEMPYLVAATAWTQTLGCDSYEGAATLDAFRAFRDTFLGQGPEKIPF